MEQERLDLERPQTVLADLRVEPGAGPGDGGLVARVDRRGLAPQDLLDRRVDPRAAVHRPLVPVRVVR